MWHCILHRKKIDSRSLFSTNHLSISQTTKIIFLIFLLTLNFLEHWFYFIFFTKIYVIIEIKYTFGPYNIVYAQFFILVLTHCFFKIKVWLKLKKLWLNLNFSLTSIVILIWASVFAYTLHYWTSFLSWIIRPKSSFYEAFLQSIHHHCEISL